MTEPRKDWSDLTKEKSLWEIFCRSCLINETPFNYKCYAIAFIASTAYSCLTTQSTKNLHEEMLKLGEIGFTAGLTTIGPLIAGFTIFATISKPELLLAMAEDIEEKSGLTYLKYNFFVFMNAFTIYLTYTFLCMAAIFLGQRHGVIASMISNLPYPKVVGSIAVRVTLIALMTGMVVILIQLKTFTFNIYNVVMTALRWQAEFPNKNPKS